MDFTDKVVVVTGGSSGLGAASAILFAKHGAKLVLIGMNAERLQEVGSKCLAARGIAPLCLQLDLTETDSCAIVVTRTIGTFGRIDVLVNSAGKFLVGSLFDENMDVFDEIMQLNLRVPYKLTQLAVPYLVKMGGNIVNIMGVDYVKGSHGFLPSCIAKSGLEKFTKMAALELATTGVRINSVQCGFSKTNILRNTFNNDTELMDLAYKAVEQEFKLIEPEEIAKMVVFAASELCPNLNGAELALHGGSIIRLI